MSDSSGDDGEVEEGKGTLDHLPDVREVATGVSLVDVRLVVESDTPETRAVSPVGSAEGVAQATPGMAQPSPRMIEGVPGSGGDQPVPADTEAVPPPPPPPLQRRDAIQKRLLPCSR